MNNIKDFTWGKILKVHEIGEYEIIEYDEYLVEYAKYSSGQKINLSGNILYHPYLNGKDLCCGFETLDEAIVYSISQKYEKNPNCQSHIYFNRMIGLYEQNKRY